VTCDDSNDNFIYRQGVGSHTFAWSPRCQSVSLRLWGQQAGGVEHELTPRLQEWRGPLAFPQLLQRGHTGSDRLRWQFDFGNTSVQVEYRLRSGERALQVAHRPPPRSLRD
jgi:hypothetical protein